MYVPTYADKCMYIHPPTFHSASNTLTAPRPIYWDPSTDSHYYFSGDGGWQNFCCLLRWHLDVGTLYADTNCDRVASAIGGRGRRIVDTVHPWVHEVDTEDDPTLSQTRHRGLQVRCFFDGGSLNTRATVKTGGVVCGWQLC